MTKQKKIKKRSKIVNVNKSDYRKSKNKCVSIIISLYQIQMMEKQNEIENK